MTLRLPTWAFPAAIVALLLSGWWIVREHDARVRADALAELRTAQADSMAVALEVSDRQAAEARAALDSTRAAADRQVADAERAERAAESRVRTASRTLDATLDSLAALSGSAGNLTGNLVADVRAQLEAERQAHGSVAMALRAQVDASAAMLAASDSTVGLLEGQLRARDALIGGLEESLVGERELALYWRREARPPWYVSLWRAAPVVVGGAAVVAGAILVVAR